MKGKKSNVRGRKQHVKSPRGWQECERGAKWCDYRVYTVESGVGKVSESQELFCESFVGHDEDLVTDMGVTSLIHTPLLPLYFFWEERDVTSSLSFFSPLILHLPFTLALCNPRQRREPGWLNWRSSLLHPPHCLSNPQGEGEGHWRAFLFEVRKEC